MDTALYGKPTQDWVALYKQMFSNPAATGTFPGYDYSQSPASPAPALKNDAYLGKYTNDFFGDISIIEKDNGLAIVQGPKKMTFAMKHYDRDIFTYETAGENAVGKSGITFTIGPDGKAVQFASGFASPHKPLGKVAFHFPRLVKLPISSKSAMDARCTSSVAAQVARQ